MIARFTAPNASLSQTGAALPIRTVHIPAVVSAVAAIAALYGWGVVALTPTHPGSIGLNLNALGTDWMVFYLGPQWFFHGNLGALFDGDRFTAYLNSAFSTWLSQPTPFRPWVYPPSYLLAMLPFGMLPFAVSYVAFQVASAALLAAALWFGADRKNARPLVVGAVLLGPAAAINAGMGQNGFLIASFLVGGFRILSVRPALGGAILGMATMKPQFWLLVPVALAAGREWKALAWSILAAAALALASAALFGIDSWRHWLDLAQNSYANPHGKWVELGRMWGDSIYACLVSGGASEGFADAGQTAGTLIAIGLVYHGFRLRLPRDRKIAVLLACTILAAPHSSLADTVLLATAAALWSSAAAQGNASLTTWTLALALWLTPLFNPPLVSPLGRLTPVLILGFIAMTIASAGGAADAGAVAPLTARRLLAAKE
jgi:Glycosyltransferase family 87